MAVARAKKVININYQLINRKMILWIYSGP